MCLDLLSLLPLYQVTPLFFYGSVGWIVPISLKLQKVPIEEFEQTFDYGLKDLTKLDDFNQVVE